MSSMPNQRKIAVDALITVGEDYGYSNLVLQKAFRKYDVPQDDRAFITALFYGVLDRKITLDYIISRFTDKPFGRIKPVTLYALRIALFQILYMDSVPERAAVDESVNIVKHSKEKYNAGFVNAVLRNFLRSEASIPTDNSVNSLEIRYSCPKWIIESFISDYGVENTVGILEHSLKPANTVLRINSTLISDGEFIRVLNDSGVNAELCGFEHAAVLNGGVDISQTAAYKEGLFHVEDLPSQIAVSKLGVKPGEAILDMCSAPGGKTFTAAQNASNAAKIKACDVFEHRVELISAGAKRLKLRNIEYVTKDSAVFDESLGRFDAVICDVPCSGLGVIRRKPEIKYKENLDLDKLCTIQKSILSNGLRYLKKGGRLLYSTCTLRRAENEAIVRACLDNNADFEVKCEHTFLPTVDGTDGFYYCLISSR